MKKILLSISLLALAYTASANIEIDNNIFFINSKG